MKRPWLQLGVVALLLLQAVTAAAQLPLPSPVVPPEEPDPLPQELSLIDGWPVPEEVGLLPDEADPRAHLPVFEPPVPVGGSGEWLRSGTYYFEADALLLNRDFYRLVPLAIDATTAARHRLVVRQDDPGMAAATRMTLGHNLFRDLHNRNHSFHFTFTGLGEWVARGSLEARTPFGLISSIDPFVGTADAIGGFNLAQQQQFRFKSDYDSFEWNYQIEHRPGRDLLVLEPGGRWVQHARTGSMLSVLAGVRWVKMEEDFEYLSTNELPLADPNARRGTLRIQTGNHLVGVQLGGSWMYQGDRWNAGVRGKAGPYVNFAHQTTFLEVIDPVLRAPMRDERAEQDTIAFVGELGVFGRYHIRPNFSFRVAYEALWLNSLAIAPHQINFDPPGTGPFITTGGAQMYQGFSLGWELTW